MDSRRVRRGINKGRGFPESVEQDTGGPRLGAGEETSVGMFPKTIHREVVVPGDRPTSERGQRLDFMPRGEVDAVRETAPRVGHTNPTTIVEDSRVGRRVGREIENLVNAARKSWGATEGPELSAVAVNVRLLRTWRGGVRDR